MADVHQGMEQRRVFRISTCLGRGGFGEVYRAEMLTAGGVRTDVAIKVLHKDLDPRSQAVQRLRDEGRMMGVLRHPSILKCYDLSVIQGRIALVTEFVEGDDLEGCFGVIDPIPLKALLQVTGQIAEALTAAWSTPSPDSGEPLHLVHRDVKPANIRVSVHGEVKLLDFGIARAQNVEREAKTQAHTVIGSFPYMSPERFLQEEVGSASDIYALGCVLYEGIVGERLFLDVKLKEMYLLACDEDDHAERLDLRISELPAYTPPAVAELIRAMLSFEPPDRPSADEVARRCDDLAEAADGYGLRRWTRDRQWRVHEYVGGELDDTVVTEGPLGSGVGLVPVPGQGLRPVAKGAPPPLGSLSPEVSGDTLSLAPASTPASVPAVSWVRVFVGLFLVLIAAAGMVVLATLAAVVFNFWPGQATVQVPEPVGTPAVVAPEPAPSAVPPGPAPAQPVPSAQPASEPMPIAQPDPVAQPVPGRPSAPVSQPQPVAQPVQVVVVPVPSPEPGPRPRPTAAPGAGWEDPSGTPAPAPTPVTQHGVLNVTGSVLVEVRRGDVRKRAGYVPAGTWQVFADFGSGLESTGQTLSVLVGGTYDVSCSKLRRSCVVP
jgi:eukaryotic-like serine/threonine-protein kinase